MKRINKMILAGALIAAISTGSAMAADQELYNTWDGSQNASKITYEYKADSQYEVHTRMGYVTDIKLKPGESITYLAAGDTKRWLIDKAKVGNVTHVYIKPIAKNIMTNMIINSSTHSYRLLIDEGDNYTPIIEFSFPLEDMAKALTTPMKLTKEQKEFNAIYTTKDAKGKRVLKKINRNYEMKKHGKVEDDMLPVEIFDDGIRTAIKMPQSNKYDLPTLYLVDDENKLTLVNYRPRGDYFVADRVFRHARLKYSSKSWVDIKPKKAPEIQEADEERNNN